jgi:16S rRNA (cytidine1402-2'-O)-methyltransferase
VSGTLYLVPNLLGLCDPADVLPARTLAIARQLSHFIVETPKVARAFLKTVSPERVIADIAMFPCDPANAAMDQCATWLKAGIDVGVVSDAGCPGMADPGATFVALAHRLGAKVVPLVGPSSVLLGLMASGMNGQLFTFHGYLPNKTPERDAALKAIDRLVKTTDGTHIFIETPYRNAPMIDAIRLTVSGNVVLCVAQALSSAQETIICKPVSQWTDPDRIRLSQKEPTLFLLGALQ